MRLFLFVLRHPTLRRVLARIGLFFNVLPGVRYLVPSRFRLKSIPWRQGPRVHRHVDNPDVWLFTGCVMDSWFRRVHSATIAILEAMGSTVGTPPSDGCCGALHVHAGSESVGVEMAKRVITSMPGSSTIVVNSAGCGAMLKEYGELIGTDEARSFSERVLDIHEWIQRYREDLLRLRTDPPSPLFKERTLIVQEPCHLRHVQKVSIPDVLDQFVSVARTDDDAMCCGAGGAYSLAQPHLSREIRSRKFRSISRASKGRRSMIVTSNPGCHLHLAGDGYSVISSAEVVASVLGLIERPRGGLR